MNTRDLTEDKVKETRVGFDVFRVVLEARREHKRGVGIYVTWGCRYYVNGQEYDWPSYYNRITHARAMVERIKHRVNVA